MFLCPYPLKRFCFLSGAVVGQCPMDQAVPLTMLLKPVLSEGLWKKFHINYNLGSINQIPYLLDPYHSLAPYPQDPLDPLAEVSVQLMVIIPWTGPPRLIEFHSIDNNVWRKTFLGFVQFCTTALSLVSCRSHAHFLWDTKYFVTFHTRNHSFVAAEQKGNMDLKLRESQRKRAT